MKTESIEELDKKLKAMGLLTLSHCLKPENASPLMVHAGVKDMATFEEWLQMRYQECMSMKVQMTVDNRIEDEMFEWVMSHAAVYGEVLANFNRAKTAEFIALETPPQIQ